MRYSFTGRIRYSEIGENRRLTLPSLINYFQDCSNFQSEEIGLGIDWLNARKRAWVLVAWQIHVNRYPAMAEEVKVSTWAYDFKAFQGLRNFMMEDGQGRMLACANSIWAYMDLENGRPERIPKEELEGYGFSEPIDEDFGPRKVALPKEPGICGETFTVMEYHLDTNHHVNNGQFIRMALGYVPAGFQAAKMRAEYKMQAHLGDVMYPVVYRAADGCVVTLNDEKGAPYVVAEFR